MKYVCGNIITRRSESDFETETRKSNDLNNGNCEQFYGA